MSYEISGTVHIIHETQTFASGFQKREFVVKTDEEKYPQEIKLEAIKDACDWLDAYEEGDPITVSFNLRGNEYNGKHYVNLQAWKFDRAKSGNKSAPARERQTSRQSPVSPAPAGDWNDEDPDDDMPF